MKTYDKEVKSIKERKGVMKINSFTNVIPLFLLSVPFVLILGYLVYRKRKKTLSGSDSKITTGVDIFYAFTIIGILLVTLEPQGGALHMEGGRVRSLQLVPIVASLKVLFHSVHYTVPIRILGFNILLFIPFGFFSAWRFTFDNLIYKVTIIGASASLFIEITQFILPFGRTSNIDDIILNTLGTLIGAYMYILLSRRYPNRINKVSFKNLLAKNS